jgi:hypothetical protein
MKEGTFLYRGSNTEASHATNRIRQAPNYLWNNHHAYFTNNENHAKTYGRVVEYETIKPLKLINMGNVEVVKQLINLANTNKLKNNIQKSFPMNNGKVVRSSEPERNNRVSAFIRKQGYNGYCATGLRISNTTHGTFHPEYVLCKPKEVLKVFSVQKIENANPPKAPTKSKGRRPPTNNNN